MTTGSLMDKYLGKSDRRIKRQLDEKYFTNYNKRLYGQGDKLYVEIFINSSKSEIRKEMNNSARFIADDMKKVVYFWDSLALSHHVAWDEAIRKEIKDRRRYPHITLLGGIISSGVTTSEILDWSRHSEIRPILATDWIWADKYVKGLDKSLSYMRNYYNEWPEA